MFNKIWFKYKPNYQLSQGQTGKGILQQALTAGMSQYM
jgi:hypothetical protein